MQAWVRLRRWWSEPHFLGKIRVIGIALLTLVLAFGPGKGPWDSVTLLILIGVLAVLPLAPKAMTLAGLPVCLAAVWLEGATDGSASTQLGVVVTLFCLFLGVGYVWPRRVGVAAVTFYALAESAFGVWGHAEGGAVSTTLGFVDGFNDSPPASGTLVELGAGTGDVILSPAMLFVAATVMSCIVSGFAVTLGYVFSERAASDSQLARTRAMIGRLTREQELAHMIHDSVANDVSVIAMLAWRAKGAEDDGEMLDAIYERAHHALDRTHEVIDVLNGVTTLEEAGKATGMSAGVAAATAGAADAAIDETARQTSGDADAGVVPASGIVAWSAGLERYCEDQDRVMHMLGFAGSGTVVGAAPDDMPEAVCDCVSALVQEIYANIVRHCQPDGDFSYSMFIALHDREVRVTVVNPLEERPVGAAPLARVRRGRGLALQRESVEALGGTLNAAAQDGSWVLTAVIPW